MASSRDRSKKVSQGFCQLAKRFFEDFYTRAAKAGRHPLPLEAMGAFMRMLEWATDEDQAGPEPPPHLQLPMDAFEALLDSNLFQQIYLVASNAYARHTPGLDFKKGKPGRPKVNAEEIERLLKLHSSGQSYRALAKENLKTEPEGKGKKRRIDAESERIRAVLRRVSRTK